MHGNLRRTKSTLENVLEGSLTIAKHCMLLKSMSVMIYGHHGHIGAYSLSKWELPLKILTVKLVETKVHLGKKMVYEGKDENTGTR